jgi:hypothetical protein
LKPSIPLSGCEVICEISADNPSKARLKLGPAFQRLIPTGEQSGLQTHIAATESVSLCEQMKG